MTYTIQVWFSLRYPITVDQYTAWVRVWVEDGNHLEAMRLAGWMVGNHCAMVTRLEILEVEW